MLDIDDSDLRAAMAHLGRAMRHESVSNKIKRETSKHLRQILQPLVKERQTRVLALPSRGHAGEGMRQAIARQTKAGTRWSGKNAGVSIIQKARGMPRDFRMAGRMFNREEGWSPQNLGGITQHQQIRPAAWFDDAATTDRGPIRKEVIQALDVAAGKIADDIRRIR